MPKNPDSKSKLRRQLRSLRQALDGRAHEAAAARLGTLLADIPALASARHIASYHAADGEIDPRVGVRHLRENDKTIYLPVILSDNSLRFAPWRDGDILVPNRFGIPEPRPEMPLHHARELDAVLMPLVGWDKCGRRLGMGGGFYDRSLVDTASLLKIGLGFESQQVDTLPVEPWDVALDFVVTEKAVYNCRSYAGDQINPG